VASANVNLVKSIYSAWEVGDWSSSEWAHPEIEFVLTGGPVDGSWTGLAGMAEGFRGYLNAWKDFRVEADDYRELDDERVLVLVRMSGRGKTSGLELGELGEQAANLFYVRDGKVVRLIVYSNREQAAVELGLPSQADSPRT
jgi:SnoaL-like domain